MSIPQYYHSINFAAKESLRWLFLWSMMENPHGTPSHVSPGGDPWSQWRRDGHRPKRRRTAPMGWFGEGKFGRCGGDVVAFLDCWEMLREFRWNFGKIRWSSLVRQFLGEDWEDGKKNARPFLGGFKWDLIIMWGVALIIVARLWLTRNSYKNDNNTSRSNLKIWW